MAERSSSSSFSYKFTYDVFLSFKGSDTRLGFTGHLWKALHDKGIHTFIDDRELQRGDEITASLVKAIQESRIAIPVFSKDYASSSFCLDELVNIIERVKAKGRLVLPIFYDVDPSHLRHQMGIYGEALAKHEARFANDVENLNDNMDRLRKWKMALNQAASLSGHHFKHGHEYEHVFIGRIVKVVSNKINRAPLHVADYPVGLESRVQEVKSLLEFGSDGGVHMVGIYGIGGIGKTTLARALYNSIADLFEGLCFLGDVRENSTKGGLVHLQEMFLSETVGEKDIKIADVGKGISMIIHRLRQKKVLLVLDDVDKPEQLRAIIGRPNWFGSGSRVIITTRDKHLLTRHGVERKYEVDDLNDKEALELLRWTAFKGGNFNSNYIDILNQTIAYASGLPLALEVIGSNLFGKSVEEWKYALDRYERIPYKEMQNILKVSFDALEEEEKNVFLDIACCFKWYPLAEVEHLLHAHHGDSMKHHIELLVEKSLIKISPSHAVMLHSLIEDMGKEIVRQESLEEPGKRSRLWFPKDIVQVLQDNTGTNKVEIIYLDFPLFEEEANVKWDGEAFKKMENLKTLIIKRGSFCEGPRQFPNSLRVLEWVKYPSKYLPHDFQPKKLVICKLPNTWITSLELVGLLKKASKFMNIRVLDISLSECLTDIPDVSGLPNLEEFSFRRCYNLIKVDDSIGFLDKLRILNASSCIKLISFPPIKLTSLESLQLSYCFSLQSFPEILGKMEKITELTISNVPLKGLPFSFRNLTRLQKLNISDCAMSFCLPSSIVMMQELAVITVENMWLLANLHEGEEKVSTMVSSNADHLQMINCYVSDEFFSTCLTWFTNVKTLELIGIHTFTFVPESIKECRFLKRLKLDVCNQGS
ncbi:TMV resistance protein N-like [Abrus precatorius]|uniref:TMV resistance protein N-like n=1 Tax=Abrus precatorius TaxID=3816 RepID=A0A8B8LUH0_ABRPR|nr:TMV resistance protein N-like [Abrus precatorius]